MSENMPSAQSSDSWRLALIAVAAVVAVAVGLFVLNPWADASDPKRSIDDSAQIKGEESSEAPDLPPVQRTSESEALSELGAKVSALNTEATSEDQLPEAATKSGFADNFVSSSAARKATTSPAGFDLYLVPVFPGGTMQAMKGPGVCLLEETGAGSCASLSEIDAGKMVLYADHLPELPKGDVTVRGIVPNGVDSVTITFKEGTEQSVSVKSNTYVYEGPGEPQQVSFKSGDSEVSADVPGA